MKEPSNLNATVDKFRKSVEKSGFELRKEEEERLRKCYKMWWNMSEEELIIPFVRNEVNIHANRLTKHKQLC